MTASNGKMDWGVLVTFMQKRKRSQVDQIWMPAYPGLERDLLVAEYQAWPTKTVELIQIYEYGEPVWAIGPHRDPVRSLRSDG